MPFWKKTDKGGKKKPPKPAVPRTAQQSIPMQRMFEDGTCRVKPNYYTRTIQYQDINYQLAQQEDKTAIFEEWCSFLNFFDSSIKFELSFVNMATDSSEFEKSIRMKIKRFGALLVSAVLCIGLAAPAFAYEGDTTPVEQPVLPEVVEEDTVTITDEETGALTPEGNLTLVDDYYTNYSDGSGQQFITMVSKSGATFYLVIDRNAKGQQTVHFMNLVDESDLLALMDEDAADAYTAEKEAEKQAELDKLKAEEEAKKAAEEAEKAANAPKENKVTKYAAAFLGVVAMIALAAGGGFYFFIQQKSKKQAEKEAIDPDADYTEDKGNFEIPPEDDSDEDTSEEQDVTPI